MTTASPAPARGTTEAAAAHERTVATIAGRDLIGELAIQVQAILLQLGPAIVAASEATLGTEKCSATITIAYKPGDVMSDARFDVAGKATIPAIGTSRICAIEDGQLKMFDT